MAGMPVAVLCGAHALCIILLCCGHAVANDPPRSAAAVRQFFPSRKLIAGAPTLANSDRARKGPVFFVPGAEPDCDCNVRNATFLG